jgi:hypothetical protein
MLEQIAPDLSVRAGVGVLVAEAAEHLHGGVPLLGGSVLVGGQDLVDDRLKWAEDGGGPLPGLGVGEGLGLAQDLADLVPGVMNADYRGAKSTLNSL